MKDMKLIMETWRKFEDTAKDKETHVFLFENNEPIKTNFNVLLEQYDSKQLTEDQLVKLWEDSFNYEYEQLLKEVDWEKEAELTADPDYKPPQERGGVMEKVGDFVLKKAIQLTEMAKRGVEVAAKLGKALLSAVGRFKESYPLLFKFVSVIVLSAAMFALMAALSPDAQAAIAPPELAPGVEPALPTTKAGAISDKAYEVLRGLVHDSDASMPTRTEAMALIDKAQQAKEAVDLSKLNQEGSKFAAKQLRYLDALWNFAKEGDTQAQLRLMELYEIGKDIVYKIGGKPTR
tara:strand:+ start:305 stop:1177 length:873 start_codon:yes stop_codon:yes gene_type:complete